MQDHERPERSGDEEGAQPQSDTPQSEALEAQLAALEAMLKPEPASPDSARNADSH